MSKNVKKSIFVIAKLLLYYVLYQLFFTYAAMIGSVVVYAVNGGLSAQELIAQSEALVSQNSLLIVWATSLGLLFSSIVMLWHLIHFKYFNFGKSPFKQVKGNVMLLSIVFIFCSMTLFNYAAQLVELPDNLSAQMEQLSKNLFGLFAIAVTGPILEEVLFRGAIQGYLMRKFSNPWVGIIIASLIFGIIHLNPIQVFYAFFLGLAFGWLYYRTGSLMPSIIGHVLNNSLAACMMYFGIDEAEMNIEVGATTEYISLGIIAVIAAVMVYLINKKQPSVQIPWRGVGDEDEAENVEICDGASK